MPYKVDDIIYRVQKLLVDDGVRWTIEELLAWVNDAQAAVAIFKPDATSVTVPHACVAGTKQQLPTDALLLLDVPRNLSGNRRAIRICSRDILDTELPEWHNHAESGVIKHYVFDERQKTTFYVFPPAVAGTPIEVVYSAAPAVVDDTNDPISVDDIYIGALTDYVCYRALSKDAEYAANSNRAGMFFEQFLNTLGVKQEGEAAEAAPRPPVSPASR